ncbi:hypothetical protein V9K67_21400 [Paraflavisolibacter sp. H34]|uniref:hypothetical protein n=1 Tax=Huijunlia imazamoxiresistens TaxID=3127457 RepID=UPI00301B262E
MKAIDWLVFMAVLLGGCKAKGDPALAAPPSNGEGNLGMDFISDSLPASLKEDRGMENSVSGNWEGVYYPLFEMPDGRILEDSGAAIRFKMAPDGRGVYREAQLFGDYRSDFFSFEGQPEGVAVSPSYRGWTYYRLSDSTLKDNSGNRYKKSKGGQR